MKKYLDYDGAKVLVNKSLESFAPIEHKHNVADIEDYVAPTQSDWSENDENSLSYIQNRPFYAMNGHEAEIFSNQTLAFSTSDGTNYTASVNIDNDKLFEPLGDNFKVVWDGVIYDNLQVIDVGGMAHNGALGDSDYFECPFYIEAKWGVTNFFTNDTSNSHTVAIYKLDNSQIIPLSDKYIPYKPGKIVPEGKPFLIDGVETTAKRGAEIFNDYDNVATGWNSHAEGQDTIASGNYSHAEGLSTKAFGESSHAEGYGTKALGQNSHAEGLSTKASGENSHAEGQYTTALGNFSHAEGISSYNAEYYVASESTDEEIITAWTANKFSLSKGEASHVEGYDNLALGNYSHAEGNWTTASGIFSHAEGAGTTASYYASHAEGSGTLASNNNSHAEGQSTTASGSGSHAEGNWTIASGSNSHTEGEWTIASGRLQHVQGKYNIEDTENKYAHIVGNGEEGNKSNAHTLDWDGNGWFAGSLYVGGTSQDDAVRVATLDDITKYNQITMVDEDNGYDYVVAMKNGTLVSYCACTSIAITTLPSKTEYTSGETFDTTDMVVTATCQDGNTREITNYTYTETVTGSSVVISYVERGITYTAEVTVTIV